MGYSSRCSICTHRHAGDINDLLRRRALGETMTLDYIVDVVERLGGPSITTCALSRHNSKHFNIQTEGRKRAVAEFEAGSEEVKQQALTDLEACDLVRDRAIELMGSGDIDPDVKDLLNSMKVKRQYVIGEDSPVLEFLEMVVDVARGESGGSD